MADVYKTGWAAKEMEIVRKQVAGPASFFFPVSITKKEKK